LLQVGATIVILSNATAFINKQNDGTETIVREYILYTPQNYSAEIATPLIINMHGFGDCAANYSDIIGNFYGFNDLADQENIIVAYPQGAWRPEKEDNYWEQIFACGYSNGGMMTYSLACHRSTVFAGIGIMSGAMLDDDCMLENPVPIIKFHGIADYVLPYDGSQWYSSVEETIDLWLEFNNMTQSTNIETNLNGGDVVRTEHTGNSCVTLYTINEEWGDPGGHVWFSDDIDGASPSQIMWDFFDVNCNDSIPITSIEINEILFSIFPNPVTNLLSINNAQQQEYQIRDTNGKLLLEGKIDTNAKTIDLEQLANGVYTIQIGNQINKLLKVE